MLVLVIAAALVFDYVNGFHDTANAIATCVSTRALSVKAAIIMAAGLNFAGAMISTKVAATIGKGIVDPANVTQMVVLAGIVGAIIWDLITWYYGLPSSSSHAIIGGLMGAVIAHAGMATLHWKGLEKIVLALVLSPVIGTTLGFSFMVIMMWCFRNSSPYLLNRGFRRMQILSAAVMAFSHGTADAQKSMGVITLALVSYGYLSTFQVPPWVMILCATAMASRDGSRRLAHHQDGGEGFRQAAAGARLLRGNGLRGSNPRGRRIRSADQHHPCHYLGHTRRRPLQKDVGGQLGNCLPDSYCVGPYHTGLGVSGLCCLYCAEPVSGEVTFWVQRTAYTVKHK